MAAPSYQMKSLLGTADPAADILAVIEANLTTAGWVFVEETPFTQTVARLMRVWKNPSTLNAAGTDFYVGFVKNTSAGSYLAMRAFEGYTVGSHTMQRPCLAGPTTAAWKAIAYGGGQFVAVGNAAGTTTAATSPDGINWTARTMPAGIWTSLAYGNSMWVAVSAGSNTVATSPDGITWTSRATSLTAPSFAGIAYGNNTFVVASNDGTTNAGTSPDGITWTNRTIPAGFVYTSITFGGLFIAVNTSSGASTNLYSSPDGITWTARTSTYNTSLGLVVYGAGAYLAFPTAGAASCARSTDGITWVSTPLTSAIYSAAAYNYTNSKWVATTSSAGSAITSSDGGATWSSTQTAPASIVRGMAYGAGLLVTCGDTSGVTSCTTTDGATGSWTSRGLPPVPTSTTNWLSTGATTPLQVDSAAGLAINTNYDVAVLASKSYVAVSCNAGGTGTPVFAWVLGLFNPAYADTQSTTPPLMALALGSAPGATTSGVSRALRAGTDVSAFGITAAPESLPIGLFNTNQKDPVSASIRSGRVALFGGANAVGSIPVGFRGWLYDAVAVGANVGANGVKANDSITIGATTYNAIGQLGAGANVYAATTYTAGVFFNTTAGT